MSIVSHARRAIARGAPMSQADVSWCVDGDSLEIYLDGYYLCSVKIADISAEMKEIIGYGENKDS